MLNALCVFLENEPDVHTLFECSMVDPNFSLPVYNSFGEILDTWLLNKSSDFSAACYFFALGFMVCLNKVAWHGVHSQPWAIFESSVTVSRP